MCKFHANIMPGIQSLQNPVVTGFSGGKGYGLRVGGAYYFCQFGTIHTTGVSYWNGKKHLDTALV